MIYANTNTTVAYSVLWNKYYYIIKLYIILQVYFLFHVNIGIYKIHH